MSIRFYCPDLAQNDRIILGAEEAKHLSRVCRLKVGDVVEVFDGKGIATAAEVIRIDRSAVELLARGTPIVGPTPPFSLTLATAVPKGDRFDWLVEKATELGVERLIPLVTDRSVVEPSRAKLERLRRAIIEASKQCGRNQLLLLQEPISWSRLVELGSDSLGFVADPEGLPSDAWPAISLERSVILAVGPEGGLTQSEKEIAATAQWASICLNSNILRIETAGVAGCAALFSRFENSRKPRGPSEASSQTVHCPPDLS